MVSGDQWGAMTTVQAAHLKFDITHTYVGDTLGGNREGCDALRSDRYVARLHHPILVG